MFNTLQNKIQNMKKLIKILIAIFTFLAYSSDVEVHTKQRIHFRLLARWYSPFFWAGAMLFVIGAIIFGGMSKIKPMIKIIKEQFDKNKPVSRNSWSKEQKFSAFEKFLFLNS